MATAVVIGDQATRVDIENAVRVLWQRRRACMLEVTRLELEDAVDDLLDRWLVLAG